MAEWLILLLLVPAIVVPVVLLVGFAGCSFEHGTAGTLAPLPPTMLSAIGKSVRVIHLTWTYADPDAGPPKWFDVERTKLPELTVAPLFQASSPHDDQGLEPATSYSYRVRAVFSDDPSGWSESVVGTTLSFEETFSETLTGDDDKWEGYCLVQRIEPVRLSRSGTEVKLTLRASSVSDASIDKIYISKPAGQPKYASASDLTAVTSTPFVVPANTAVTLPAVNYTLDEGQPLLIAVDFKGGPAPPPSGIRYTDAVTPQQASAYYKPGSAAAIEDRADFTSYPGLYLIEKIEVG
jgi:hypothetical protein